MIKYQIKENLVVKNIEFNRKTLILGNFNFNRFIPLKLLNLFNDWN